MMLDLISQLTFFCISLFAGFLGALMGIGGGIILVPTLTFLFDLPIQQAIAVSIVSVVATSISGGSSYVDQRITNIRLAIFLETSTTLGAFLGALLVVMISGNFLYFIFAFLVFFMATTQIFSLRKEVKKMVKNDFTNVKQDKVSKLLSLNGNYIDGNTKSKIEYMIKGSPIGWLISFFAGVGSGLLGIGGGVFQVSAMNLFMNVPLKVAVATSKFMIGVTAATSAVLYYISGVLKLGYIAPAALGVMIGATAGTMIMNKLKVKWLKIIFFFLMIYIGYNMLGKGILLTFSIRLPLI
jgi:uncharacterized membrane protein YfcA